jgi:hypothetical protein
VSQCLIAAIAGDANASWLVFIPRYLVRRLHSVMNTITTKTVTGPQDRHTSLSSARRLSASNGSGMHCLQIGHSD